MNSIAIANELEEAVVHLKAVIERLDLLRDGADEETLAWDLGHVLNHICHAWHFRNRTETDIANMPQVDFDRLAQLIPNFDFEFALLQGREE